MSWRSLKESGPGLLVLAGAALWFILWVLRH